MAAGDVSLTITLQAVDAVSNIVSKIADNLGGVAGAAVTAGAAMVGLGVNAATAAGNFQQLMEQLVTSAGESQNNIKMLSDGILKMSVDTGTSTDQLAKGMYYIESSGIHAASGLAALQVAAEGAKSENADLSTVSQAMTTVLTDYHMKTTDAASATLSSTQVMNGLIATVQNGKTNLQSLASAMGAVLPTASSLGISFSQVAGVMDVMTNSGVSAQQAAQNLNHVFLSLSAPAGTAVTAMRNVGLSAQEVKDALVSKGLPDALQLIEEHIGQHFPAGSYQAEQALKAMTGGIMGFKEAAILTGDNLKIANEDIKNVAAAMGDAANGVLGWDVVQGEFNFKLDQAKAAINAMMITLGTDLLPVLGKVVDWVTQAIESFTQWESQTHFVEDALGVVVTAIGWVIDGLSQLGSIVAQIWSVIGPTFDSLATSATTWGQNLMVSFGNGIIAAASAVIDAVVQIAQEIANYLGFASPTKKGPGSTLNSWGQGMVAGLAQGIVSSVPLVTAAVGQVANQIGVLGGTSPSGQFVDAVTGDTRKVTVTSAASKALAVAHRTGTTAATSTAQTGTHLTRSLASGMSSGVTHVTAAAHAIGQTLHTICKPHAQAASACAAHSLTTGLAAKIHAGKTAVGSAVHALGTHATAAAQAAAAKHQAAQAAAAAKHQAAMQASQARHEAAVAKHNAALQVAADKHAAAMAAKAAKAAAKAGPAPIAGAMPTPDLLGGNAIQKAVAPIQKAANDAAKAVTSTLGSAATFVKNAWNGIAQFFQQIWKAILPGLQDIWRVVKTQLAPSFVDLWNAVKPLFGVIVQLAGAVIASTLAFAKWFLQSGILKTAWDALVVVVKVVISTISTLVGALVGALKPVIDQIVGTFQSQLMPAWQHLVQAIQPAIPLFQYIAGVIGVALVAAFGLVVVALGVVVAVIGGVLKGISYLVIGLTEAIGGIVQFISGFLQVLIGFWTFVYDLFTGNFSKLGTDLGVIWQGILDMLLGIWHFFVGILGGLVGFLVGLVEGFVRTIIGFFTNLYNALVGHSIIPDLVNGIISWFAQLPGRVLSAIASLLSSLGAWFANLATNAIAWVRSIITSIVAWFATLPSQVGAALGAIGNIFGNLVNAAWAWGHNMIVGFVNGIISMASNVTGAVSWLMSLVGNIIGFHSPAKEGPGRDADTWGPNLVRMFASGMVSEIPTLSRAVQRVASPLMALKAPFSPSSTTWGSASASSTSGQPMIIYMTLDSKTIGKSVTKYQAGELRVQGAIRSI